MVASDETDLHQGLRIVAIPSLEVPALRELSVAAQETAALRCFCEANRLPVRKLLYNKQSCKRAHRLSMSSMIVLASRSLSAVLLQYPSDEVVFKRPLDELMEEIGGQQFMDVRRREVAGKWLQMCQPIQARRELSSLGLTTQHCTICLVDGILSFLKDEREVLQNQLPYQQLNVALVPCRPRRPFAPDDTTLRARCSIFR